MKRLTLYFSLTLLLLAGFLGWWWSREYRRERTELREAVRNELREFSLRVMLDLAIDSPTLELSHGNAIRFQIRDDNGKFREVTGADTTLTNGELEITKVQLDTQLQLMTRQILDPNFSVGQNDQVERLVAERYGVRLRGLGYEERRMVFAADDTLMLVQHTIRRDKPLDADRTIYQITDYRGTLLMTLVPQFLFGGLLLGATGLAFGTARRNLAERDRQLTEKDALVANLAHELKTPIATVGVALEAISDFGADAVRQREYLAIGRAELDRLDRLADRALATLNAGTDGTLLINPASCDLAQILQNAWDRLEMARPRPSATLKVDGASSARLRGDAQYLDHLCHNLLDNARKYGGEPLRIHASFSRLPGTLRMTLRDNGPGIPAADRKRVFERFYRLPGPGHAVKGHGLGLAFVRQIAVAHGGRIRVTGDNTPGAIFILELPLA